MEIQYHLEPAVSRSKSVEGMLVAEIRHITLTGAYIIWGSKFLQELSIGQTGGSGVVEIRHVDIAVEQR